MAIDRYIAMAAAPGVPGQIRVRSSAMAEERSLSLDQLHTPHGDPWMRYVQGVIAQYDQHGVRCPGLDVAVVSSVPPGGGLSSSAALELATAHLLEAVTGQTLTPAERIQASVQAERGWPASPAGSWIRPWWSWQRPGRRCSSIAWIRPRGQSLTRSAGTAGDSLRRFSFTRRGGLRPETRRMRASQRVAGSELPLAK